MILAKVLVVANNPFRYIAPNIWLFRVLPLLAKKGFAPEVIFFHYGQGAYPVADELKASGISVHLLPFSSTENDISEIIKVINRVQPEIFIPNLNIPAYFAAKWARSAGIKTIGILRSDDDFYIEIGEEFVWGNPEWRLDGLVCVSEYLANLAIEKARDKVLVMSCPSGAPVPEAPALPPDDRLKIVYCGRFVQEQKRILDLVGSLISVCKQDPAVECTLFGSGPLVEKVEEILKVSSARDRIRVGGFLHPNELQAEIRKYHVFVLLSDYEGLSTALVEAMACGLVPIVLRTRSGIDEIVRHDVNGLIVEDRDAAFRAAIQRLRTEKGLWERLSVNARKTIVEQFSSELCADRWAGFLKEFSTGHVPPAIPLLSHEQLNLPPKRSNLKGMAREDRRLPTPESLYLNPVLWPNTIDVYWDRLSTLTALRATAPLFSGRFLDVGCGIMPYKQLLTSPAAGSRITQYIGLDIETETYHADVDLRWDGKKMPLADASIDSAMATEVLEHCPEPLVVLKEIRRVLKPGGVFFFTVPYIWPLHDAPHDYWRYTPFSLKKLLSEAGFADADVKALSGWNASLAQMMGLWLKRAPMTQEKRNEMAQKLWPLYQELVTTDQLPDNPEAGNTMATGWSGIAYASAKEDFVAEPTVDSIFGLGELCIARRQKSPLSETFINNHVRYLAKGARVIWGPACCLYDQEDQLIVPKALVQQLKVEGELVVTNGYTQGLADYLKGRGIKLVLIEYGRTAGHIYKACLLAGIPYVVHFHGYDASNRSIRRALQSVFPELLREAQAIVVVSKKMLEQVVELGAPVEKIHINPYGVQFPQKVVGPAFTQRDRLVYLGRFVEKKAPLQVIQAFALAARRESKGHLVMIGEGPLRRQAEALVRELKLEERVQFTGALSHRISMRILKDALALVQHSVTAVAGDTEGLPNSVLEAGGYGVPVIGTRHAGIPDVIEHGKNGYLVEEGDVVTTAKAMIKLLQERSLAEKMGQAHRERVEAGYQLKDSLNGLNRILAQAVGRASDEVLPWVAQQSAESLQEFAATSESIPLLTALAGHFAKQKAWDRVIDAARRMERLDRGSVVALLYQAKAYEQKGESIGAARAAMRLEGIEGRSARVKKLFENYTDGLSEPEVAEARARNATMGPAEASAYREVAPLPQPLRIVIGPIKESGQTGEMALVWEALKQVQAQYTGFTAEVIAVKTLTQEWRIHLQERLNTFGGKLTVQVIKDANQVQPIYDRSNLYLFTGKGVRPYIIRAVLGKLACIRLVDGEVPQHEDVKLEARVTSLPLDRVRELRAIVAQLIAQHKM